MDTISQATRHSILKSETESVNNNNMSNELSELPDRVSYIQHQAMKNCSQEFENSVNGEGFISPQEDAKVFLKCEIKEEGNDGNASSFIDRINEEYENQNEADLNDPLDVGNSDNHNNEAVSIEENGISFEVVEYAPDVLLIPSEANDEIVEIGGVTSHEINTGPNVSHKCHYCKRTFRWKHSLARHLTLHLGKEEYDCENCFETFETKNALEIHRRKFHSGEGVYKCEVCHKSFYSVNHLWRHAAIHNQVTPFKCDVCDKTFTRLEMLRDHKRLHEKPYKCDTCDKCFALKRHLIDHTRNHTGERPFKCNTCGKRFVQSGDLKRHTTTIHTGEK